MHKGHLGGGETLKRDRKNHGIWKRLENTGKLMGIVENYVKSCCKCCNVDKSVFFVKHVLLYRRNIRWNEYRVCIQLGQTQVPIIRPKMWSESSIQTFITEPYWAILSMEPSCLPYTHRTGCTCVTVRHWMDKSEYVLLIAQMSIANRNDPEQSKNRHIPALFTGKKDVDEAFSKHVIPQKMLVKHFPYWHDHKYP